MRASWSYLELLYIWELRGILPSNSLWGSWKPFKRWSMNFMNDGHEIFSISCIINAFKIHEIQEGILPLARAAHPLPSLSSLPRLLAWKSLHNPLRVSSRRPPNTSSDMPKITWALTVGAAITAHCFLHNTLQSTNQVQYARFLRNQSCSFCFPFIQRLFCLHYSLFHLYTSTKRIYSKCKLPLDASRTPGTHPYSERCRVY